MTILRVIRRRSGASFRQLSARLAPAWLALLLGCGVASSASSAAPSAPYQHSVVHDADSGGDPAHLSQAAVLEQATYVRAVLRQNPSIESARQAWRAALARVRQAGIFEDPMLDFGVAPLSIASSRASFGYVVGLSQRLPWFGKRSFEAAAAAAEASAVKSDLEAMRRELALAAVLLYDQYFVTERSLEINAHHLESMQAMRDAAMTQFQAGRGSAQDSLQAEAELAHMEHDAVILASQREVTLAQLNELLHRAPDLPLPKPPDRLPLPALPSADAPRLQADALAHRTEIAAARQRAQAALARAEGARRDYYPDITLSTSYNSMWEMPEHRWMVGVGLSLPLQTERRAAAEEEAQALHGQFESDAARLSDAARTQVFVALRRLQESEHVLRLFEQRLLPVAKEQIDAARAGFVTSQSSFLAVVTAEKNLRSVELERQMAGAEFDRRHAELDRALGRIPGLDARAGEP